MADRPISDADVQRNAAIGTGIRQPEAARTMVKDIERDAGTYKGFARAEKQKMRAGTADDEEFKYDKDAVRSLGRARRSLNLGLNMGRKLGRR